jgi:ankyrin repeat protein
MFATFGAQILRMLLSFGADPNQRGTNDYTPLHMAVDEKNSLAIQILLDAGADPELRTRIDARSSPLCSTGWKVCASAERVDWKLPRTSPIGIAACQG